MKQLLEEHLKYIKSLWFIINDEEKIIWYLEKVGFYRLRKYFNFFEDKNIDFQIVINLYLFDKNLRNLNLNIIESIEIYIKNIFILTFWNNYLDESIYSEKIITVKNKELIIKENRIKFINDKILYLIQNDSEVAKILEEYKILNAEVFINKLTFWEIIRFIQDLDENNKRIISRIIWIKIILLENWLDCLVYLRNICSHWENVFNKEMLKSIKWYDITDLFWAENKNNYISYFAIISIFRESLIPNYKWEEKIFKKMKQYNINLIDFWQKKETFPNELDSEAWKVLVNPLYKKYVKKSNILQ